LITLQQARKAKQSLLLIVKDLPTIIGLAYDNDGYFLIAHISEPIEDHNIPNNIDGVRVVIEITGLPRVFGDDND